LDIRKNSKAAGILAMVGLCGEFPMSQIKRLSGYYDYNRRLVTRLVQGHYLRERKFEINRKRIQSLSLTDQGLQEVKGCFPNVGELIKKTIISPRDGQGDWKKTLRLHRGAACIMTARHLDATIKAEPSASSPPPDKAYYYPAYMLNKAEGKDSKGARASGVLVYNDRSYILYYLGSHNMRWVKAAEDAFYGLVTYKLGVKRPDYVFICDKWEQAEGLLANDQRKWSNLIHFPKGAASYIVTADSDGDQIMKMIMHPHVECLAMKEIRARHDIGMYAQEECEFFVTQLSCLYDPPMHDEDGDKPICCFPFQQEAIRKLNHTERPVFVAPQSILEAACTYFP
jgi:hypothetical protein